MRVTCVGCQHHDAAQYLDKVDTTPFLELAFDTENMYDQNAIGFYWVHESTGAAMLVGYVPTTEIPTVTEWLNENIEKDIGVQIIEVRYKGEKLTWFKVELSIND